MDEFASSTGATSQDTVPEPRSVMLQSLMIPGWGQITNQQSWKVPLIYGVIGGMIYTIFYFDNHYQGYRAAYYNAFEDNTDQRFGPTPGFVNPNFSTEGLRQQRNFFRNRRDLTIVLTGLAYALNAVDAYVFAHLRDFDVSDDLSMKIHPDTQILPQGETYVGFRFSIQF